MNLIGQFLQTAEAAADRTAIVLGNGQKISFGALAERSAGLARHWQRAGISRGDRVLIAMPVGPDLYAAIAGLWRIGATIIFPEPALGLRGLAHALELAKPKAFLASGYYRLLRYVVPGLLRIESCLNMEEDSGTGEHLCEVPVDHPALLSFTSGSTGQPKCIVRSHGFLAAQDACVRELIAPNTEFERDLVAFPVFVIANLGQGVTSVLPNWKLSRHDRVAPDSVAQLIRSCKVTRALVPPSICEKLTETTECPSLNTIFTGGGPAFPDLLERLAARYPDTDVVSVYGSTEAEPISHIHVKEISASQWQAMRSGKGLLAGRPVRQISVKLRDDEIVVTGDHVNKGYLNGSGDAENKIKEGDTIWHRTGDAGTVDDEGDLWLWGRHSAKAGNLYPFQAEVAARSWPGAKDVALVPNSDPPLMAVSGRESKPGVWQSNGEQLGINVLNVNTIPLDRRHHSKVDYQALRKLAGKTPMA